MKRKSYILLFVIVLVLVIFISGCGVPDAITKNGDLNLDAVETFGNRSCIHLNIKGNLEDNYEKVLNLLTLFEESHPRWEVIGWKIFNNEEKIFALIIDHKPKPSETLSPTY
ncbi:MAG: hypothetical protein ABH831_01480 [Candidatus Nealsonbacteria bacterium]